MCGWQHQRHVSTPPPALPDPRISPEPWLRWRTKKSICWNMWGIRTDPHALGIFVAVMLPWVGRELVVMTWPCAISRVLPVSFRTLPRDSGPPGSSVWGTSNLSPGIRGRLPRHSCLSELKTWFKDASRQRPEGERVDCQMAATIAAYCW